MLSHPSVPLRRFDIYHLHQLQQALLSLRATDRIMILRHLTDNPSYFRLVSNTLWLSLAIFIGRSIVRGWQIRRRFLKMKKDGLVRELKQPGSMNIGGKRPPSLRSQYVNSPSLKPTLLTCVI